MPVPSAQKAIMIAPRSVDGPVTIPVPWLYQDSADELPFHPGDRITLRLFYERCMLAEDADALAARTLAEYRCALNRWEETTADPDIRDCSAEDLRALLHGLSRRGQSARTINKTWRHLRCIFNYSKRREVIRSVPSMGRHGNSRLVKEQPKQQREALIAAEVASLIECCRFATYPEHRETPTPKLWSVAIYLFWMYGARTFDVLRNLTWDCVRLQDRLLRFQALKTSKLQGLPLTDLGLSLLRSIRGHSERVFPGFHSKGSVLSRGKRAGTVKRGYYTTWNQEISGHADVLATVKMKHFRETAVTRWNGVRPNLGSWIAAHYMPGVTAQHYDHPTREIREAIEAFEVPPAILAAIQRYQ